MSNIGPQLPSNLAKRKRSSGDDSAIDSRPSKQSATNQDEIDLVESSEDDFGPPPLRPTQRSICPTRTSPRPLSPPIGPTIPGSNTDEIALDPESDSEAPLTAQNEPSSKPRRTFGPAMPPAPLSEHPASDSDSDSDSDDYGPALPSTAGPIPQLSHLIEPEPQQETEAPKRDDWMLAPPTSSARAPDPTKLKSRTFTSGRSTGGKGSVPGEIASIWTETPQEKLARLQNSVLGRETTDSTKTSTRPSHAQSQQSRSIDKGRETRIEEYTAQTRGKSLYEETRAARKVGKVDRDGKGGGDDKEDDPSQRPFDREKDMALGGRIGAAQRKDIVSRAANFGGRFEKGSYL